MIRITQLKLPVGHDRRKLTEKAARLLRVRPEEIRRIEIVKRSIDARRKDQIRFVYTLDVETGRESQVVKRAKDPRVAIADPARYHFPAAGGAVLSHPPVIIGSGPAGLFAGYMLARAGYCPLILERGDDVDTRRRKVEDFWAGGVLDERTNVQFGEGGAGTFSDGKLNTTVQDPQGRNRLVLEILTEHGADPEILWDARPHIGTDVLGGVVKNIREHIRSLGGQVLFGVQATDILIEDGHVRGVRAVRSGGADRNETPERNGATEQPRSSAWNGESDRGGARNGCGKPGGNEMTAQGSERRTEFEIPTDAVILAIGHSARDTFSVLEKRGIPMQPRAFAVGLRIQHPQRMIDESQYGTADPQILGHASYKLTHQSRSGRGVYSFCMCPGGFVVNASSEPMRLAINGMSDHERDGLNANSALIVTVTPADFEGDSPLAGVEFQRRLEELAYRAGEGRIPVQLYGDFRENRISRGWGDVKPQFKGGVQFADLRGVLPEYLTGPLIEGMESFEHKIRGFSRYDSILAGVESRTTSPVRILRNEHFESAVGGLFPCGEGAGYAGGITSAAIDGVKVAEELARRYRPGQPAVLPLEKY